MKNLSSDIKTGYIKANTMEGFKSEYNKYLAYAGEKRTLNSTWLNKTTRKNIEVMMATISSEVEAGHITKQDGAIKMSMSFDGIQNIEKINNFTYSNLSSDVRKEIANFDADAANEEGILNIGFGSEQYAGGAKALALKPLMNNTLEDLSSSNLKDYITKNLVPIRGGVTGQLALPMKKTVMIYTQGRDIKPAKVSAAIMQRIKADGAWGKKASNATSDLLVISQSEDDSGNLITYVSMRSEAGTDPTRIYSFTLDELEAGKIAYEPKGK